ncbi:MAG TPA: hypothetical protein VHV81_00365 [Steroidobacteraceae bacterium]|nr:hypothetical protein [Steroidobacteraceae bacterium]
MKTISLPVAALLCLTAGAGYAGPAGHSASVTHDPLVMRVSKDEFRIAFGVQADNCAANGCSGVIRYRVNWKAADGVTRTETRRVAYVVSPRAPRTIAVDRQYFHDGEGRSTTEIVKVKVDGISCIAGVPAPSLAKL